MEHSSQPLVDTGYFIYFAVLASNLNSFAAAITIAWTSPVLPQLQSNNTSINPLPSPINTIEQSFVTSSMNLGCIFGTIIAGALCQKLGKKRSLLILTLPIIVGHLMCSVASHIYTFIAARLFMGVTTGSVFVLIPAYLSEIAEDNNRGLVGSMFGVTITLGITFTYMVGPFLSVKMFSLVNLTPPTLHLILFGLAVPESPYDLVKRGQSDQALSALVKLRGKEAHLLASEFIIINESYLRKEKRNWTIVLESKSLKRAFIISIILIIMQQFTGIGAVLAYMQPIFEAADSSIPAMYAPMIISTVQMVSNLFSSFLVDKAGRRPLLIASTTSCIVTLATLAGYFQLKVSGADVTSYGWIPLATMFIFMIVYNMGLANLPWIIPAELFPANFKSVALSATSFTNLSLCFIVVILFPNVSDWLGMAGPFYIYLGVLCVGLVFIVMMVPETKGKSSLEIQSLLEGAS